MIFRGNLSAGTLVACTNKRQKKELRLWPSGSDKSSRKKLRWWCVVVSQRIKLRGSFHFPPNGTHSAEWYWSVSLERGIKGGFLILQSRHQSSACICKVVLNNTSSSMYHTTTLMISIFVWEYTNGDIFFSRNWRVASALAFKHAGEKYHPLFYSVKTSSTKASWREKRNHQQ